MTSSRKAGRPKVARGSSSNRYTPKSNVQSYAGGLSLLHGIAGYYETAAQRRMYEMQGQNYLAQAQAANFNAYLSKRNISGAYEQGAFQAMVQGMQDAQIIAQQKAKTASSGVKVGSGSAKEIEASQRLNAAINQDTIQKNTTAQANKFRIEEGNYLAQAIMNQGNAQASQLMAKGQQPLLGALSSIAGSLAMYDMQWQMAGNNSLFSF